MKATRKHQQFLQTSVFHWLNSGYNPPDALALNVGTHSLRERADIAAVWFDRRRRDNMKLILVLCCASREECWPECNTPEEIIREIAVLRDKQETIQTIIRKEEPYLRDPDILFDDMAVWKYKDSTNPDFHEVIRRIATLEGILYRGSRMAHLSKPPLADYLYLAVPSGTLFPNELREDWGLLWVQDDGTVIEKRQPLRKKCKEAERLLILRRMLCAGSELAATKMAKVKQQLNEELPLLTAMQKETQP
ncbi:MAG: hypothetical protein IJJ26_08380 [Victivallales bacterium]|nr:hypothetical protein [Victivallales bacterium]